MAKCTCYSPLIGLRDESIRTKNGKAKIHIYSRHAFSEPFEEVMKRPNAFPIPCGKCIGCRLRYARSWANRLMLEASLHQQNHFITLTYKPEKLPYTKSAEMYGIDYPPIPTLVPNHFTKFMKRLRITLQRKYPERSEFKYYMCGEYGDKTARPHYHFIALGLELDDLYYWNKSKSGKPQYRSPLLEKIWPFGIVTVSECSWNTCAYVARYVMKKQVNLDGDLDLSEHKELFEKLGFVLPYVRMSNGIAKDYYYENFEKIYEFDEINLSTPQGGLSFKPPAYFDNLFEQYSPDDMDSIRGIRQDAAKEAFDALIAKIEMPYEDYLKVMDDKSNSVKKALVRDLE